VLIKEYQEFLEKQLLEDKHINPHTLVFTQDKCNVLQLSDLFEADVSKESIFNAIADLAGKHGAHKVMLITEVWYYKSEEVHTQEEIDKALELDTSTVEQLEGFQIIEITKHNISLILRSFERVDGEIKLGKDNAMVSNNELLSHAYKCIQDNLITLM